MYMNIPGTCKYKVYKIMYMYMTSYYMYVVYYLSCFHVSFTEVTLLERFNNYCYNKLLSSLKEHYYNVHIVHYSRILYMWLVTYYNIHK